MPGPSPDQPDDLGVSAADPVGRPARTGRFIALGLVLLWLAVVVGLSVVLVRLKLGGAEALRAPDAGTPAR